MNCVALSFDRSMQFDKDNTCTYKIKEEKQKNWLRLYEPRCEKTGLRGFPTRSDTNRAVQPQKMARGLKFRI